MAITLRNVGIEDSGNNSVTLPEPTNTATDDFMIAFIVDRGTSGSSTPPAGWTLISSAAGADGRIQLFYAIKGYSENLTGTSWQWATSSRTIGVIIGWYNASHAGLTGTPTTRYNSSGTTGTTGLTTGADNSIVIGAFGTGANGSTWSNEACATDPSSLNELYDSAYSNYVSLAVAAAIKTTAGATGDSSATMSTPDTNVAGLCALAPAGTATVTTSAVESITATTASGHGNVTDDGGSIVTERGVCINTTGTPTTSDTKFIAGGTTGDFYVAMIDLDPGQHYYCRAYAINGQGTSYGTEVEFDTPAISYEGILKTWDGGQWITASGKVYIGGSFVSKPWKFWDGAQWQLIDIG